MDISKCKLYRDKVSFANGMTITDVRSIWIWQRDYGGLEPSCIMKCHCSNSSNCNYKQLKRKERERKKLRRIILEIFACLIKANKNKIVDTLRVDDITTLRDYMALILGIEGDQTRIEEQIQQKLERY